MLCKRSAVFFLVMIASFISHAALSDVIPPDASDDDTWVTVALSYEGVGVLERPLSERTSFSFWGGGGIVWNARDNERTWGGELAAELRGYVSDRNYTGANCGAYLGIGLYDGEDQGHRITITPGMKFTISQTTFQDWMLVEPYIGVSYPIMRDLDDDEWVYPDTPYLTFGLRLVFRYISR